MNYKILWKAIFIAHDKAHQKYNQRNLTLPEQNKLRIDLVQLQISNYQIDSQRFVSFIRLRGGGACCCPQKINKIHPDPYDPNSNLQQIDAMFIPQLPTFANIISDKALCFQNKLYQDDVLAAFQWFQNNKKQFHILCNNQSENKSNYQLIERITEQLMKQLIIYIKISGFLFHQLLQICNDLLRIIFSFQYQQQNENRYMQDKIQKEFLETIDEVYSQIQVEAFSLWMNGVKFELSIMKTCVLHLRTNSENVQQFGKAILKGIVQSVLEAKFSADLLFTLFDVGKFFLLNFTDKTIHNPFQVYEIYYYFQNLTWSIVFQLENKNPSIKNIIGQIQDGYQKYIKLSKNWKIHYFWVNMLSEIMFYRPITEIKQQIVDQETLDSYIIRLPYSKFAGKLKLLENHNFTLKKYESLKLFQEYLIQNQIDIQLLPNYISFNFNTKQGEQFKDEDRFIQSITNQTNLEILKIFIKQVKYQYDQITSNLEKVKAQVSELDSKMKSNDHMKIQIFGKELKFLMKQIKQSSLLLLYLVNQINLLVNKELQINEIVQKILQGLQFNAQDQQSRILKEQIENDIEEIQVNHKPEFNGILQRVSYFWIQISQYTSFSYIELIEINLEFEITLKLQLDYIINDDKFLSQISKIKSNFLSLLQKKEINSILKESFKQINLEQIIIQLFNPQLIIKLINECYNYYEKQFKKIIQKENLFIRKQEIEGIQIENIQIENIRDIQIILISINSSINICKGLQMILKQHQKLISSIQTQFQRVFEKIGAAAYIKNEQNQEIDIEQNTIFIKRIRDQLLQLIEKYQNQKLKKEQLLDFNIISNQIKEEISKINKMDWQEETKTFRILLLSKIKFQLDLLNLEKYEINYLKQVLDEQQLQQINSEEKSKKYQPINKEIKQTNDEFLKLKLTDFFDCEVLLDHLEMLITQSKNIKNIISQNCGNKTSQNSQIMLDLFPNTQVYIFKKSIYNVQKQTLEFYSNCKTLEQIIFNEEFLEKRKNQTNFEQIPTLLYILNFDSLNYQDQGVVHQGEKVNIVQNMIGKLKNDMKVNYEESTFDIFSNSSYKVREQVVFNLIKIQSTIQEQPIEEFCEDLLKQIWIIEEHPSVRNLLKNDEMLSMQKRLFSQDLQNFSQKIKIEMQTRFEQINYLKTQALLSDNQDEIKKLLLQKYDDFEIYLDNITDMSQRLDISLIFLREISKDLKNIKSSIDSILKSLKSVVDDIRRLRGKNFMELLTIRKQKVLHTKLENELDQIHIEIKTQEYDPISGNKKQNKNGEFVTFLMKSNYYDYDGEVNEFLWSEDEKQKDVMLIKGKAGSGKSRASCNIEEFIWINDSISPNWIPIYVSLPSIKDPNNNLIEQAFESENYNFDSIQIREFKDAVMNGKLRIVIILESYDEMKIDCIGTNLYQTNRLAYDLCLQAQEKVKFIITTREEILNSIGYQTWFYGSNLQNFKEVEILPFSKEQSSQYLKIYTEISFKRTIKKFYEFLKQLKGQNFQLDEFKLIWSQIENTIYPIIQMQKSDMLFENQAVERLIKAIQNVKFFSFIQQNQIQSLKKELLQLWGEKKYQSVIINLDVTNLLCTPFMMEIIVYVLPEMYSLPSKTNIIRELLKKNYVFLKMEAKTSEENMEIYSKLRNNNFQIEAEDEIYKSNMNKSRMKEIEINQQFAQILEILDKQNFFKSLSMADSLQYESYTTILSNKNINVDFDVNFIVSAFKLHKYTAFEFYEIFVNFYHNQQRQKFKAFGQNIKEEIMISDLQEFSIFLAIDMTMRQLTQVNYQQKGRLYISQVQKERNVDVSWEDSYFSENQDDFEYKTLLRKCMLINSKGSVYAFNHKSIQEFFVAKYIVNLLEKNIFKENQTVDQHFLDQTSFNKSLFNLSLEHYSGTIELLKPKIKQIEDIKNKLIKIALLSRKKSKNSKYNLIRSASNSIYILGSLKEHLDNINLRNLNIADTKLDGISFYQCNLSNSKFNNVSIDSCNFNCATLEHATWKNLICKEKPSIKAHNEAIKQVVFSDDGKFLISGSQDGVIFKSDLSADSEPKKAQLLNDDLLKKLSIGENWLACLSRECLYLYNLLELKESQGYRKKSEYFKDIEDIRLSPNDKYLALFLKNGKIIILQVKNLLQQQEQQSNYWTTQNIVKCLAISSDYQLLATGDTQIKIWKYTNISNIKLILELPEQKYPILSISFSKDNQVIAVASDNKKLEFFNISNLTQVPLQYTFDQQQTIQQIAYSNDGQLFASRSLSSLKIYEVQQLHCQQDFFRINSNLQVDLIEISSDSQILATSHQQSLESKPKITIWDIKNLQQIKKKSVFEGPQKYISTLKIRNDNIILGSGSIDHSICLWNLIKLELFVKLTSHLDKILDLAFSSDGNQMVSSSKDDTIVFWNITKLDKQQIVNTPKQQEGTKKLIFCPNTPLLVSIGGYSQDKIIQWDSVGLDIISIQNYEEEVLDINFNENGDIMVSLNDDRYLRIWTRNEQCFYVEKKKILIDEKGKLYKAYCLNYQNIIAHIGHFVYQLQINDEEIQKKSRFRFSDTSCCNRVSQNNKIIAIKDSKDFNVIEIIVIENHNSQNNIYYEEQDQINDFQFSNDSSLLAVATKKGAFIKDIKKNEILQNFQEDSCCFLICFIGIQKLSILLQGELVLYETKDMYSVKQKIPIIQSSPLKLIFLDKKQEICLYSQNSIILINLQELQQIKLIQLDEGVKSRDVIFAQEQVGMAVGNHIQFISLSNPITLVLLPQSYDKNKDHEYLYTYFQQDNNILSVFNTDLLYYQFDIKSNQTLKTVELKNFGGRPIALNNQQTLLIVSKQEGEQNIMLIDMETKKRVTILEKIPDSKFSCVNIVFSQDGQNFVTSYSDLRIKFWDTKSYKLLSTFKTDTNQIQILTISIKGILAQTSNDIIKLWDLNALKQQQLELDGHSSSVRELCISSDGLQLITGSEEEIIRWDLIELKKLDILIKGKRLPQKFCFSPNSQYFIAQAEQSIHIWKFNTKYIIEFHKIYWCEPALDKKLFVDQNLVIYKNGKSKIFILNLEYVSEQIQLQFQSDLKNQARKIILSTNLLIKTNPLEIIHINDKLELNNEQIDGISASQISNIAFCANSKMLAFEEEDHSIIIWSIQQKQRMGILNSNKNINTQLLFISFSGNSKILFSYHFDKKIRCWKITDKFELIKLQDLSNHLHQKYSLDLHLHPIKDEEFILIWAEVVEIQPQCWVDKFYFQIGHDIEELCIPIEDFKNWNEKFTTAFNESNSLIALQIETILKLYDISQGQRRVVATLEGNPLDNLMFSSDGKILLSLGIDLTLRLYDISDQNSLKVKINLKNPIQALAMSLLNQYSIRIFTELGTIIDQNISDYKEIVVIKDENQFDYTASIKQLNMFKYSGKVNNRTLEILDSQTSQLKYTLDKFSSKINAISFAPSQEQFVLGMEDGQILFYKIDQQTTKIYDIPVCYHIFAKNRLLTAQYCKIRKSTFKTIENVNFEKVLCEYGAIK